MVFICRVTSFNSFIVIWISYKWLWSMELQISPQSSKRYVCTVPYSISLLALRSNFSNRSLSHFGHYLIACNIQPRLVLPTPLLSHHTHCRHWHIPVSGSGWWSLFQWRCRVATVVTVGYRWHDAMRAQLPVTEIERKQTWNELITRPRMYFMPQ